MPLLPTYCKGCQHAALVDVSTITDGGSKCRECGGIARTLPGQMYGTQDVSLFKDLEATLREARLSPLNAGQLALELEDRDRTPGQGLKRIARLLPSLAILELIVSNEPSTQRKAEGMLLAILDAMAATRSQSGMMPALGSLRGVKTGHGLG